MLHVLIAEDEAAIGLALEDLFTDHGYLVEGPFQRCAKAMAWLEDHTPDLALLDLRLADGSSLEIARLLRRRNVPVLFLSGEISRVSLPADLQDTPWLDKPAASADLLAAIRALSVRQGWQDPRVDPARPAMAGRAGCEPQDARSAHR